MSRDHGNQWDGLKLLEIFEPRHSGEWTLDRCNCSGDGAASSCLSFDRTPNTVLQAAARVFAAFGVESATNAQLGVPKSNGNCAPIARLKESLAEEGTEPIFASFDAAPPVTSLL